MTKLTGWGLLGLLILYRRTWGQCQCSDLGRRLAAAHRELAQYQYENLMLIRHHKEYHNHD